MAIQKDPSIALTTISTTCSMQEKDTRRKHRRRSTTGSVSSSENTTKTFDICNESAKINFIISQLLPEDLEIAARSSHQYLKSPSSSKRNLFAKCAVRRCLQSKKGNVVLALAKVKKMIEFRRKANVDELIISFDDNDISSNERTAMLHKHLATKKFYVQGFDKEGRSTLYFIPRNVIDHDLDSAIYSIERAIASSRSLDKEINCVVDFSDFPVSNIPPMEIGKQFLTTLRVIYTGQIHRIFLVNVPFSFSILWNIFSPFVGTDTRDKIVIIKNNRKDKEREILPLYELEELPSWCVEGGGKKRSLDVYEYLFLSPFNSTFDDQRLQY